MYREREPVREELLLGSKMVFRGVAFYSGAPARVFAEDPKRLFYTTPPAPAVSSAEDLERLPENAFPLYAILRDRELIYLRKVTEGRFAVETTPAGGRKSLVRIERTASSTGRPS